ncbi:conserved domain protein, partial [Listeria innocua FSL S4-378]
KNYFFWFTIHKVVKFSFFYYYVHREEFYVNIACL